MADALAEGVEPSVFPAEREESWHRRLRKKRARAKAVLRGAVAALHLHHGSEVSPKVLAALDSMAPHAGAPPAGNPGARHPTGGKRVTRGSNSSSSASSAPAVSGGSAGKGSGLRVANGEPHQKANRVSEAEDTNLLDL